MSRVLQAECRVCGQTVYYGNPCEHLEVNELGQAYQVHPQHQGEPDPYAVVVLDYLPGDGPGTDRGGPLPTVPLAEGE
jgi:hypothetical protein